MMEFDQIVVKESPGLCRCCLSEGCYKDLGSEYTWMNETEVYADMLLECFDISISQHNEGPNGPNRLICEVCITRLRDACNFKKQVLDSEKKFVDMVGRGEFRPKVMIYQAMKSENVQDTLAGEVEFLEDEIDFEDAPDEVKLDEPDPEPSASDVAVYTAKAKKRGRPKKVIPVNKPEKKAKMSKAEDKPKTSKAVVKGDERRFQKTEVAIDEDAEKNKRKIMHQNILQLLLKSTVMPFRWLKSSYRCFYCYEVFLEPKDLKAHNDIHSRDDEKYETMKKFLEPAIYVDVSNISCKLCPAYINDFCELVDHLVIEHDVQFDEDIGSFVKPFKLNSVTVECLECDSSFKTFGLLLTHTNKDHKSSGTLLCDICGQYFGKRRKLIEHLQAKHGKNPVKCPHCDVMIKCQHNLRTHLQNFHNKRYKCEVCPEYFPTYYKRSLHMMSAHNSRDRIACPQCPQTFLYRSIMMRHMREMHLHEKNAICSFCGWKAFSVHRLQRHVVKHSNERHFKCTACDKAFKTKKTMKQHYKNVHKM